jgi:hypothetical protein
MSLTLARMRLLVRTGLAKLDDDAFTNVDIDELLNLSLWDIESRFPFESKETVYETVLVEDQFEYPIDDTELALTLDAIFSISIVDSSGQRNKLARTTRHWIDENFADTNKTIPTRYLREGTTLILYPIPGPDEDGLTLSISLLESIESILAGTKDTTGLPRNWDEIVVNGAIWRGHFYHGNIDKAIGAVNLHSRSVRDAVPTRKKEDADFRYARLEVLWDDDR